MRRRLGVVSAVVPVADHGVDGRRVPDGDAPAGRADGQGRPDGRHVRLGPGRRRAGPKRGLLDSPDSFLFTRSWFSSGQLAFATRAERPAGALLQPQGRPELRVLEPARDWVGRDGILVSIRRGRLRARVLRAVLRADRADRPQFEVGRAGAARSGGSGCSGASSRLSRSRSCPASPSPTAGGSRPGPGRDALIR